jgi:hypothetical protein
MQGSQEEITSALVRLPKGKEIPQSCRQSGCTDGTISIYLETLAIATEVTGGSAKPLKTLIALNQGPTHCLVRKVTGLQTAQGRVS